MRSIHIKVLDINVEFGNELIGAVGEVLRKGGIATKCLVVNDGPYEPGRRRCRVYGLNGEVFAELIEDLSKEG